MDAWVTMTLILTLHFFLYKTSLGRCNWTAGTGTLSDASCVS